MNEWWCAGCGESPVKTMGEYCDRCLLGMGTATGLTLEPGDSTNDDFERDAYEAFKQSKQVVGRYVMVEQTELAALRDKVDFANSVLRAIDTAEKELRAALGVPAEDENPTEIIIGVAADRIRALRQQVETLTSALEWYARSENYDLVSAVQSDHGERAHAALAAVRNMPATSE